MNVLIRLALLQKAYELIKRRFSKSIVKVAILCDFFYLTQTVVSKHIREGTRLDFIYMVFSRNDLTISQKKDYLWKTSLDESLKENIFERYMGDHGFDYCKSKGFKDEIYE